MAQIELLKLYLLRTETLMLYRTTSDEPIDKDDFMYEDMELYETDGYLQKGQNGFRTHGIRTVEVVYYRPDNRVINGIELLRFNDDEEAELWFKLNY